jgi:hypothetical protein
MELKDKLQERLSTGVPLGSLPDGPTLDHFDALELAQAIESEVNRAHSMGHTKIRIDMTFEDSIAFAAYLRRASDKGIRG